MQRLVAAFLLLLVSPILLILMLVILLGSAGPALVRQRRVGQFERTFVCLKLRSMQDGTRDAGTHEIEKSAVTPIGRWLRRFRIDELPQLWNIVRGDMNFVGPRPCLTVQDKIIKARNLKNVFSVKPGITGLAQIHGVDMSKPDRLAELDAEYIRKRSLAFDLSILWRTLIVIVAAQLPH